MTNKESVEILKGIIEGLDGGHNIKELQMMMEALNMAIMALETSCDNCPLTVVNAVKQVKTILDECEEIQDSQESRFTKQTAIVTAYERIRDIIDEVEVE